jgi:hypothetical protein
MKIYAKNFGPVTLELGITQTPFTTVQAHDALHALVQFVQALPTKVGTGQTLENEIIFVRIFGAHPDSAIEPSIRLKLGAFADQLARELH